jgi:hypothetical protein
MRLFKEVQDKYMNKRYIFSSIAVVIMFGVLVYLHFKPSIQLYEWTPEMQREYANKLKAENLNQEAVEEYEKYISMAKISSETKANIYYTIGKIQEDAGNYEKALAYFYKVELIYPVTALKQELGEHIIACLEKMGRGLDAQYALDKRTKVETQAQGENKIVARIGKENITEVQINSELNKLPQWMQEEYRKPDKKNEFIKQYVAMELLFRKAKRLGIDKNPELRQKLENVKKEFIVQELLMEEMSDKIKITPDQVELYYKANKGRYIEPAKVRIAYVSADKEDALKESDGNFKEIPNWIQEDSNYINDIGESKELIDLALTKETNDTVGPIKVKDRYFLIKVIEKKGKKELSFEEVKDKVSYDYQSEKQKIVFQGLLDDALKAEDIEIYEK